MPGEELDLTDEQINELIEWQEERAIQLAMADANKEKDKAITELVRDVKHEQGR